MGLGGTACIPFGHGQGYDLITDFDGTLRRVQVKRAWYHEGGDRWDVGIEEIETYYLDGRTRQRKRPCSGTKFDFLAVLAGDTWYVIPVNLLVGRAYLVMRPPGCRARRSSGVAPQFDIEDFRDLWTDLKGV